jgi:hypothetical protein
MPKDNLEMIDDHHDKPFGASRRSEFERDISHI